MPGPGLNVVNNGTGDGIVGETVDANAIAVRGVSNTTGAVPAGGFAGGVLGLTDAPAGNGVTGIGNLGVAGFGTTHGVLGHCPTGFGVHGWGSTAGVAGQGPDQATGVLGHSFGGVGVMAATDSTVFPALAARGQIAGSFAGDVRVAGNVDIAGTLHASRAFVVGSSAQRALGAAIWGPFVVYGNVVLEGGVTITSALGVNSDVSISGALYVHGSPKSSVVKAADGSHRALYCVESPECWFEDFGRARLVRGKARVRLDRMFAGTVRTGDYHVFLVPEGPSQGLYVTRRTRNGFEVRETQDGRSTLAFSYRIVARRRDVDAPRFKRVKAPSKFTRPVALETRPIRLAEPPPVRLPAVPTPPRSSTPRKSARSRKQRRSKR